MKHTTNRFLVATAAVAAGAFCLQARTVAWYHFNEGANGTTPTGGQPVIMNAADPTTLSGYPYALTGTRTTGTTGNLPVFTNDMPSCVSWFDPVTGARGGDNRSIFLKTNDRKSSYPASTILIDDDAQLHCQRITVELMLKSSPEAAAKHAYGDWLHVLNMLTSSSGNSKSWGIMIRGSGQLIGIINTAENDFNGSSTSGDAGGGGAAGYLYSTVVSGNVPKITDGKWHHVAMTYDGAMVRLYVDYVLRGYLAWSGTLAYDSGNTGKLCIGANYGTSYGAWDGFIDEVRISDEALPPEKFLQIGGLTNHASDPDTAIYLPFNALDFSTDKFFGTVGQAIFHNSACSTNAALINLSLSTIGAGVYPRLDTGASAVVSNELHAGIFAANAIDNIGCWTYTNNPAYPEKARYVLIDDYSKNNNEHLISAGGFTAEFYLRVPATPTSTSYILVENSGAKGAGTLQIYMSSSWLYCRLASQDALNKYENGETAEIATWNDAYVPIADIVGGTWHHVALVVDRTRQTAAFYVDGRVVREHKNFVLASSVSTKDGYATLKIGDGWGGNNASALHGLSIDEFRITRRALAPQEFLIAGAPVDTTAFEPTRAWIDFEGDLSVRPSEAAIPEGSFNASTVTMEYSQNVPGVRRGKVVDGNGTVLRESNTSSMHFSGAFGSGDTSPDTASQRLFFTRNILLERDMKSMTVEFFMQGTKNEAKAWATILRMYGNDTGSDNSPFRRLWSFGYSNAAGNVYVIKDDSGNTQATFYPDNSVSFADDKWHHVAITFEPDGSGKTLCNVYKDYQQLGSQHTFNGELECGDYGESSFAIGSRFNGYIDEVRVSKGVLTVGQMLHVHKGGMMIVVR